jgi:hypothetical protein
LRLTGRYLLAFHACNAATTDCRGPQNHQTYVAQSNDGATWTVIPGYLPYGGSVPDLVRRGNTLYVFTVSPPSRFRIDVGQLRRYRIDTDTWESPVDVRMAQGSGANEMFVDPSPTVDDRGRIVLFYMVGQSGGDPAHCLPGQASCIKLFRSATEVEGSDGTHFVVDPGNRAEVTIAGADTAADPDIFSGPQGYVMYVSRGPSVQAMSSSDLRGTYANIAGLSNGLLVTESGGIPAGHYATTTGQYWTYVHQSQGAVAVIRRAEHAGLSTPVADSQFSTTLTGSSAGLGATFVVESPGFAVNAP